MTLQFICPITTINDLYTEYVHPYKMENIIENARNFVINNQTDLFECGAYPYCAIVSVDPKITPQIDAVELYQFNKETKKYEKYSQLSKSDTTSIKGIILVG